MADPIIQSIYGYIIPTAGEPIGTVTGTENIGAWNETRVLINEGRREIQWGETARARVSNAPLRYAGLGVVLAYAAVRFTR